MREDGLIIEAPHLQSLGQRVGSALVSLGCWMLWIYFLIPLVSLSGWLLGIRKFSAEVRWFGGYKSLVELMQIYATSVLAILSAWLIWTCLSTIFKRSPRVSTYPRHTPTLSLALDSEVIKRAMQWKAITVSFNDQGQIIDTQRILDQ